MADYTIQINAEDKTKASFGTIESGLGRMTAGAGKFKAAIGAAGAAIAAFAVGAKIKGTIDDFDNLAKAARAAGATASGEAFEGFQVMKTALAEAGVDASTADRAFLNISQRMKEGSEGGKAFAEVFGKMKGNITDANGALNSSPEILEAMVNALNDGTISADEFQKVVGGRAGPVIAQQFASLQDGAEGLSATLQDVKENANIVPLDAAENAEVFNDTIGRLGMQMQQLLTDAITPLMPVLVKLADEVLANMPAIVDGVSTALSNLSPVFEVLGTLLTEVVFPIMQKTFEVLGRIFEAIGPLVETALPHLKDAFQFVSDVVTKVYNAMVPLYEAAIPALKAGFDGIVVIVESVVGWFNKAADAIQNIYNRAISLKDGITGAMGTAANSVTNSAKNMYNGATGYVSDMYHEWWGGSIFPDLRDGVISAFRDMAAGAISNTQHMSTASTGIAGNFMTNFGGTIQSKLGSLMSSVQSQMGGFQNIFQGAFGNVINAAQSAMGSLGSIFGGGGGGGLFGGGGGGGLLGGLVGGVKKIFSGFFADGGYIPSGQFGVVGEAGPEFVSGPATVTPMGGGGGSVINFNINAIDSRSGTEFILENRRQIEGVIQNAYNRRGRNGII